MASQAHKTTDLEPYADVNGPEGTPRQFARSPCLLHSAEPFQAGGSKGGRQSPFSSERSERLLRSAGRRGPGGASPLLLSLPHTNTRREPAARTFAKPERGAGGREP